MRIQYFIASVLVVAASGCCATKHHARATPLPAPPPARTELPPPAPPPAPAPAPPVMATDGAVELKKEVFNVSKTTVADGAVILRKSVSETPVSADISLSHDEYAIVEDPSWQLGAGNSDWNQVVVCLPLTKEVAETHTNVFTKRVKLVKTSVSEQKTLRGVVREENFTTGKAADCNTGK